MSAAKRLCYKYIRYVTQEVMLNRKLYDAVGAKLLLTSCTPEKVWTGSTHRVSFGTLNNRLITASQEFLRCL